MMFWSNSSSSTYRTFAQIWAFDLSARSLTFSVCTRFIKILRSTSLWKFRQRQGQCGPMWQIRPSWGTAYVMNIWGGYGNRMQYEMLQLVADSCFALAREEGKLLYTCVMLCAFYLTGIIWTERLQMACTDRGRWLLPQETLYCAGPVEAMQGDATYQAIRAFGAFGYLVDLGCKLALKMNGKM